jgi:hypothetical protein
MGRKQTTGDVLNARAKANGYKRGAHREEDSRRDCSKHKDGRQACYDGALGARGIHSLQSFGTSKPVYDNNAYIMVALSKCIQHILRNHRIQIVGLSII